MSPSRLSAVALLLLAAALAGCASTPTARWAQARESLTVAQDAALELHAQGVLPDRALVIADPAAQAARAALQAADEQLPDGPNLVTYLDAAERALAAMQSALEARQ